MFRAGDFNLKVKERAGGPFTTDDAQINTLIENNRFYTTRELAEMLKIPKFTIHVHFVKFGYINRFDKLTNQKLCFIRTMRSLMFF